MVKRWGSAKCGMGVSKVSRGAGSLLLMSLLLVGCGDDGEADKTPPDPLPSQVLARSEAASLGECPHGGTVVIAGLDHNRNQQLDGGEEQTRTVLCNPAPAEPLPQIVLRLVTEPAGPNCSEGGTAVQSGRDQNRNGRLDDGEVEHTDYVCDAQLVTRMSTEPAGTNCVAGGIAFQIGRDRDNDGALADGEVEWTEYECSDVLTRDVTIRSAADAATLAFIRVIDGDVLVRNFTGEHLSLPLLQHVNGSMTLEFNYVIGGDSLHSVQLPKLTEIDDDFTVEWNADLELLNAPELREIGGDLFISNNAALSALNGLPALHDVKGDVSILDNDVLESIELLPNPGASTAKIEGQLLIKYNPLLTGISTGSYELHRVEVYSNDVLASLTLDVTRAGLLDISNNPQLATLNLHIPFFEGALISTNPSLRVIDIRAHEIAQHLQISAHGESDSLSSLAINQFYPTATEPVKIFGTLTLFAKMNAFTSDRKIRALGDCAIGGTQLTSLNAIERVDGRLLISTNPLLTSDSSPLPVKGGMAIYRNPQLRSLAFLQPNSHQTGAVEIIENAQLTDLGPVATGIQQVDGAVRIASNPLLATVPSFTVRTIAHWLHVDRNASLTSLRFPALTRVGIDIELTYNNALVDVQMPALTRAQAIEALMNPAFNNLQIPSLAQVESVSVHNNVSFPSCSLAAVCARFPAGTCSLFANDEGATCPPPPAP